MKQIILLISLILTVSFSAMSLDDIVSKAEKQMRGDTSYMKMSLVIKTKRWTRTIKMESWAEGTAKSFLKINYPRKDKGVTFLKLKTDMWQYVPKIERTIKYPPSMMLQSWMGTDFSNDDLVKESSIVDDYTKKLLGEDLESYTIELIPKEDAAVTWGKIVEYIDKTTLLPVWAKFYDEDNELIRTFRYEKVVKLSDRYFPTRWVIEPASEDKKDNRTTLIVEEMIFDKALPKDIFTLKALKRRAR